MNYTWGYLKENILSKLNIGEEEANQLGFLSRFPYYANEAMTQICSSVKPCEKTFVVEIERTGLVTLPDDFIAFSDDVVRYLVKDQNGNVIEEIDDVGSDFLEYRGYNQVYCKMPGLYHIPYRARWFFFTKEVHNADVIPAPADICDAIPSYVASQCFKIDDEAKAALYRNEYEIALARIDDTSFKSQRGFHIGGGW